MSPGHVTAPIDADLGEDAAIAQARENAGAAPGDQARKIDLALGSIGESHGQTKPGERAHVHDAPRCGIAYSSGGIRFGSCFFAHRSQSSSNA